MYFTILNKYQAAEFSSPYRYAIIGVVSPDDYHPIYRPGYVDLLKLNFHDVDFKIDMYPAMTETDAEHIVGFAEKNKNKVEMFMVHCNAGISRSSGIAAALSQIYNGDDTWVFGNPQYIPNMWVYRGILSKAEKMGVIK